MKSALKSISRIAIVLAVLVPAEALFGQMYPQPAKPSASSSPSTTTTQEAFPPDNPYFRKKSSPTPSPGTTNATAKISQKDKGFLLNVASSASWEVRTSSLVEGKLQNASVKSLATRVIADQNRNNGLLTEVGKKKGLAISVESKGQQIPGPNYDKNYLTLLAQDNQEAIGRCQKEAQSGDDPEIKSFATKILPTLRQHASLIKEATGKVK